MKIRKFLYNKLIHLANFIYPSKRRMKDKWTEKVKRLKGQNNLDKYMGSIKMSRE